MKVDELSPLKKKYEAWRKAKNFRNAYMPKALWADAERYAKDFGVEEDLLQDDDTKVTVLDITKVAQAPPENGAKKKKRKSRKSTTTPCILSHKEGRTMMGTLFIAVPSRSSHCQL